MRIFINVNHFFISDFKCSVYRNDICETVCNHISFISVISLTFSEIFRFTCYEPTANGGRHVSQHTGRCMETCMLTSTLTNVIQRGPKNKKRCRILNEVFVMTCPVHPERMCFTKEA